jgi:flagellar FliL protein
VKKKAVIVVALILIGGGAGAYFMGYLPFGGAPAEAASAEHGEVELDSHGNPVQSSAEAQYVPINPPFVVNFTHLGSLRFLQISLEVMYEDKQVLERVEHSMPAIRNELILLLSDQSFEKLSSLEGKEELRGEMLAAINSRVQDQDEAQAHDLVHGEVFITNFVMQ